MFFPPQLLTTQMLTYKKTLSLVFHWRNKWTWQWWCFVCLRLSENTSATSVVQQQVRQVQQQALIPQFPTTPMTSKPPLRSSAAVGITAVKNFPHFLHLPFTLPSSVCFLRLSLRSNVLWGSPVSCFHPQSTSKWGICASQKFSDEIFCLRFVCVDLQKTFHLALYSKTVLELPEVWKEAKTRQQSQNTALTPDWERHPSPLVTSQRADDQNWESQRTLSEKAGFSSFLGG